MKSATTPTPRAATTGTPQPNRPPMAKQEWSSIRHIPAEKGHKPYTTYNTAQQQFVSLNLTMDSSR